MAWSSSEIEYLKANWQTQNDTSIGLVLNKTKSSIRNQRWSLGLKHPVSIKNSDEYESTHESYNAMKHRCYYEKDVSYPIYGARGIKVCDRWLGADGWQHFLEDMGEKSNSDLRLDRIDNALGYFPENCRWVTAEQSANNRTNSKWVVAFGERKTISQWSRDDRCVVTDFALRYRISIGCDPEKSMTQKRICKKIKSYRRIMLQGHSNISPIIKTRWKAFREIKLALDWLEDNRCIVCYNTIVNRLNKGICIEDAMLIKIIPEDKMRQPMGPSKNDRFITWMGETKNIRDWSMDKRCICSRDALSQRTHDGWDFERAMTQPMKGQ